VSEVFLMNSYLHSEKLEAIYVLPSIKATG
jgi:hypothetical protein